MKYIIVILAITASTILFCIGWGVGAFGNYFMEQEFYHGQAVTRMWHNCEIVASEYTDVSKMNDSTWIIQKKKVEQRVKFIKFHQP